MQNRPATTSQPMASKDSQFLEWACKNFNFLNIIIGTAFSTAFIGSFLYPLDSMRVKSQGTTAGEKNIPSATIRFALLANLVSIIKNNARAYLHFQMAGAGKSIMPANSKKIVETTEILVQEKKTDKEQQLHKQRQKHLLTLVLAALFMGTTEALFIAWNTNKKTTEQLKKVFLPAQGWSDYLIKEWRFTFIGFPYRWGKSTFNALAFTWGVHKQITYQEKQEKEISNVRKLLLTVVYSLITGASAAAATNSLEVLHTNAIKYAHPTSRKAPKFTQLLSLVYQNMGWGIFVKGLAPSLSMTILGHTLVNFTSNFILEPLTNKAKGKCEARYCARHSLFAPAPVKAKQETPAREKTVQPTSIPKQL